MTAERNSYRRPAGVCIGVLARVVLAAGMLVAAVVPARSVAAEPDADAFVADVLALRAAGVTGEAAGVLAEMPGAGRVGGEDRLGVLWAPFFDNAIVKLGRLHAPVPVALYYNPLLDVALLTLWERQGERYRVVSARAIPGERLAEPGVEVPPGPSWMAATDGALEALGSMASSRERLRSVPLKVRRYYGDADEGGADPRMALAVEEEERALFGADTRTSDEPALAAVPALTANGDGNAEANSERQEQAVQVVVQDSDPWAADEDGSQSNAWDQEPASGGMQVAWVEVEETPEEEVMEDDGDDYSGVLNALLSDDALAGDGTSASGETVAGKGSEASADVLPAEGTRADAVETSKWPPRKRFRDCAECPEMVVVPAGSFMMGSPEGEEGRSDSEGPRHRVTIAKPFAVGVYEVTNGQYSTFARVRSYGGYERASAS